MIYWAGTAILASLQISLVHILSLKIGEMSLWQSMKSAWHYQPAPLVFICILSCFFLIGSSGLLMELLLLPHLKPVKTLYLGTTSEDGVFLEVYLDKNKLHKEFVDHSIFVKKQMESRDLMVPKDVNSRFGLIGEAQDIKAKFNYKLLLSGFFILLFFVLMLLFLKVGIEKSGFQPRWDILPLLVLPIVVWISIGLYSKISTPKSFESSGSLDGTEGFVNEYKKLLTQPSVSAIVNEVVWEHASYQKRPESSSTHSHAFYLSLKITQGLTHPLFIVVPLESLKSSSILEGKELLPKFQQKYPKGSLINGRLKKGGVFLID